MLAKEGVGRYFRLEINFREVKVGFRIDQLFYLTLKLERELMLTEMNELQEISIKKEE